MKTKTKNSKPSQKIESVYRRQIAIDRKLQLMEASNAMLTNTNKLLANHLVRVLREKETLVKMIGHQEIERQLAEANKFIGGR